MVLLSAAAMAGVGASPAPSNLDATMAPRRVAMLVGVDAYPTDPSLDDLRFAAADADALSELLAGEGYEIQRLTGQVTAAEFWRRFSSTTATLQSQDMLLVYFAGHAQLIPGTDENDLQLLFSESRTTDAFAGIPLTDLETALRDVSARQQVVVLDACYSRRTWVLLQEDTRGAAVQPRMPKVDRFKAWIYATAPEQNAQEDPDLGHGVFTWYFLEALRGSGDYDGDGQVGTLEAFSYAGAQTAAHTDYAQVPRINEDRIGWQDLPLTGTPSEASQGIVPWLEAQLPTVQVWVDGAPRGPGPIAPGEHAVRIEDRGAVAWEGAVTVAAGEVLPVRSLLGDDVPVADVPRARTAPRPALRPTLSGQWGTGEGGNPAGSGGLQLLGVLETPGITAGLGPRLSMGRAALGGFTWVALDALLLGPSLTPARLQPGLLASTGVQLIGEGRYLQSSAQAAVAVSETGADHWWMLSAGGQRFTSPDGGHAPSAGLTASFHLGWQLHAD